MPSLDIAMLVSSILSVLVTRVMYLDILIRKE